MQIQHSKARIIFDYFIIGAILAVIVQTFLDEYSRYAHWTVNARNILLFTGLLFDFTFSVEFTLRTIWAKRENGRLHYWIHERGWIDFLSSIPLLLLDSGPSAYLLLFGHIHQSPSALEVINIFKVIKAIRVTRVLRLIRVIKIFGKIHNAESKMAQHHTSEISTIAVFTTILVLFSFSMFHLKTGFNLTDVRNVQYKKMMDSAQKIAKDTQTPMREVAHLLFVNDSNVLMMYAGKDLFHYKLDADTFDRYYDAEDYSKITSGPVTIYVSHIDISKEVALEHIQSFFIIICVVLAFMVIYTRHFVQNISDILHVMEQGFRKKDYNLQVKVKKEYSDHEINHIADYYNDRYLPAKLQRLEKMKQTPKSGLSMKDFLNFTGSGNNKD
ncbi:MAG TPA: ion transporter [Spirochaetota bacterium]